MSRAAAACYGTSSSSRPSALDSSESQQNVVGLISMGAVASGITTAALGS